MNNINKSFLSSIILIGFFACSKQDIPLVLDPTEEISFQVEQSNSSDDFISNAKNATIKYKTSGWRLNSDGKIQLTREIMFDLELENGLTVEFGFWFIKYESDAELLILKDEELDPWKRNWDYVSLEVEAANFYQGFDEARVLINNNVIFHNKISDIFEVIEIEPAMVNGEEKSYITIKFTGDAFGWYDPDGEYQEVYKISNGIFKGVIE